MQTSDYKNEKNPLIHQKLINMSHLAETELFLNVFYGSKCMLSNFKKFTHTAPPPFFYSGDHP